MSVSPSELPQLPSSQWPVQRARAAQVAASRAAALASKHPFAEPRRIESVVRHTDGWVCRMQGQWHTSTEVNPILLLPGDLSRCRSSNARQQASIGHPSMTADKAYALCACHQCACLTQRGPHQHSQLSGSSLPPDNWHLTRQVTLSDCDPPVLTCPHQAENVCHVSQLPYLRTSPPPPTPSGGWAREGLPQSAF